MEGATPRANDSAVELLRALVDQNTEMRADIKKVLLDQAEFKGMNIAGQLTSMREEHRELAGRVNTLEGERDSAKGAVGTLAFVSKIAPWAGPALAALVAWFAAKGQVPHP
jgi:hypothetical protein